MLNNEALATYVAQQTVNLLPDTVLARAQREIETHLPAALDRLHHLIKHVKMWTPGQFDHLHSTQYCTFLYLLSNEIFTQTGERELPTRLFLLNKAMNAIDLFYEIDMPPVFFIGHSAGIVLAKATYGNYLVLYQNSTVGKNHGHAPRIGEGVIVYPNSAIIGETEIGDHCVLGQGTSVINQKVPTRQFIFNGTGGQALIKPNKQAQLPLEEYFRV
ncbi:hypothetical protein [Maritalea mediterranea]|uniref:Serine acetyltransferase n=1 Tax=Maritalea mediterranea TaxID=2909667 RepID=A0ABS9E482_9HYPH|nr:hypothetical protein [Maritalea mediterranea]MCF4097688.1 hypothetical protein [Maritalea mediterranea]